MSLTRPIALVGYRATGKSTVGRLLAARLDVPFVDLDEAVEKAAGRSIATIFADDGEPAFRRLEADALAAAFEAGPTVRTIATGGGVVLRDANRRWLADADVVWLTASPDCILARLRDDAQTATRRPSLTALPPDEEVRRLLRERDPLYREVSDLTVDTEEAESAAAIADTIADWVRSRSRGRTE